MLPQFPICRTICTLLDTQRPYQLPYHVPCQVLHFCKLSLRVTRYFKLFSHLLFIVNVSKALKVSDFSLNVVKSNTKICPFKFRWIVFKATIHCGSFCGTICSNRWREPIKCRVSIGFHQRLVQSCVVYSGFLCNKSIALCCTRLVQQKNANGSVKVKP